MSTKMETARRDWDGDGTFDETIWTTYEFTGDKLTIEYERAQRSEPGTDSFYATNYTYDEAGRRTTETSWQDNDLDGTWQHASTLDRSYDTAGRVSSEVLFSPDFDGDTLIGDYQNWTLFEYDAAGRLIGKDTDFYASGYQGPSDYRDETWTYNTDGKLASYQIDDPMFFDCVITETYHYKYGNLQNIKTQDEIRFGDTRPRITESFTYNKDGSLKTETDWADYSDKGWFQRVDTAYARRAGYDSQTVTYDREGDFDPEARKLVENWYNADNRLTHTLTSHDNEGDGGLLAGGFDYRDLEVRTWAGAEMTSMTVDLGIDQIIDYSFTSEWLVA